MTHSINVMQYLGDEPLTLAEVKAHLRHAIASEDGWIAARIPQARAWAETYLRRAIRQQQVRVGMDAFPSSGERFLYLPRPHLIEVASVRYVDTAGVWQVWPVASYQVDKYSFPARLALAPTYDWPTTQAQRIDAVEVLYTAGYLDAADIPQEWRYAMLLMIGHWYEHREAVSDFQVFKVPMSAECLLAPDRLPLV